MRSSANFRTVVFEIQKRPTFLLSADPNSTDLLQREHPQILAGIRVVWKNVDFLPLSRHISETVHDRVHVALTTNKNMYTSFRLVPKSMTLDDLEGQ